MTTQTVEQKLTSALKDLGQTKTTFKTAQAGYDRLKGDKRIKQDLLDHKNIGCFCATSKDHLKGTNLNSGIFGDFIKTYFPRLSANDISAAQWLYKNWSNVQTFIVENKLALNHPEAIKAKIRKALNDKDNTTKDDYDKYSLKTPAPSKKTVTKEGKDGKDEQEKVISRKNIESMDLNELCGWTSALVNKLDTRSKNNSKMFKPEVVADIERLSLQLADIHEHVTSKNKQSAAQAIKDEKKTGTDG